ncbi:unnamed protein product [Periconia digitata]|uniref:Uncharacterized protein n=1 Tax=Periconia digitata TaxID=1303443 RepID=A0A9W4UT38_9PLEO|nr:unnamed protein product [Periconia digitata]
MHAYIQYSTVPASRRNSEIARPPPQQNKQTNSKRGLLPAAVIPNLDPPPNDRPALFSKRLE